VIFHDFTLALKNLPGDFDGYTLFLADDEDTSDPAKPDPYTEQVSSTAVSFCIL
jgi:hypothetical protein